MFGFFQAFCHECAMETVVMVIMRSSVVHSDDHFISIRVGLQEFFIVWSYIS